MRRRTHITRPCCACSGCQFSLAANLHDGLSRLQGISSADFGLVISALAVTKLLGNIPAANAADDFGRRKVMVAGLATLACGNVAIGMATGLHALVFARLVTGAGYDAACLATSKHSMSSGQHRAPAGRCVLRSLLTHHLLASSVICGDSPTTRYAQRPRAIVPLCHCAIVCSRAWRAGTDRQTG